MASRDYKKNGWERGEKVGNGNQGFTFFSKRKDDLEQEWPFILKRLKRQDDANARRRMYIEVSTLRTLDHSGVMQLEESNAEEFNSDADLYMVSHRVYGKDLEQLVKEDGLLSINDAVTILNSILEILDYCHSARVIHRDLKPCHVILREDDFSSPVLIDFGLSFNEDVEKVGEETASNIGVGNRFIGLPEQQAGNSEKRDARSDVTQCVGILFFLLTGQIPRFILDANQNKPHERIDLVSVIEKCSEAQLKQLRRIFDIGFEYDPRCRWQSIKALQKELRFLIGENKEQMNFIGRLDNLSIQLAKSPAAIGQARLLEVEEEMRQKISEIGRNVHNKLSQHIQIMPSVSGHIMPREHSYPLILGFTLSPISGSQQIHLSHTCRPVGNELVLRFNESITKSGCFSPDRHETEVLRIGMFDPEVVDRIIYEVDSKLLETIGKMFNNEL
ncbi:MAG: protein kinase [Planctomycetota bacterium]